MRKTCFTVSPSSVVISPGCSGSRSRLAASKSVGSTVPSAGAANAIRTRRRRETPPIRTDQLSRTRLIADPRVEKNVGEIDQQVDQHVRDGEKQDHALHGREVA